MAASKTEKRILKMCVSPSMVAHAYNPSIWEIEAGGSGVQSHAQLSGKFAASPAYVRPSLSKQNKDLEK